MPGDPGQLELAAAGDITLNGLLSGWFCMYAILGPGEWAAIGLGWGLRGDAGMKLALGDGCGMLGGEVMPKLWDFKIQKQCFNFHI